MTTPPEVDRRALARGRRRHRRGRRLADTTVGLLGAVVLLFFGMGGWFYAGEIRKGALDPVPPTEPGYRIAVLAVGAGTVTLARDSTSPADLTSDGVWGVQWPEGYGQLGAIRRLDPDRVVRAFTRLRGRPLRVGDQVGIDGFAFPSDPRTAFGVPFREALRLLARS